jgi:hypothetical protein
LGIPDYIPICIGSQGDDWLQIEFVSLCAVLRLLNERSHLVSASSRQVVVVDMFSKIIARVEDGTAPWTFEFAH